MQDKPYALFGTCLGAITAYEIARVVEREKNAPMPVALYAAAVSPPHLYAYAVMKLYMTRQLAADEPPPFEEVMGKLRGWDKLPKETLMLVRHNPGIAVICRRDLDNIVPALVFSLQISIACLSLSGHDTVHAGRLLV